MQVGHQGLGYDARNRRFPFEMEPVASADRLSTRSGAEQLTGPPEEGEIVPSESLLPQRDKVNGKSKEVTQPLILPSKVSHYMLIDRGRI